MRPRWGAKFSKKNGNLAAILSFRFLYVSKWSTTGQLLPLNESVTLVIRRASTGSVGFPLKVDR
jgi:hypothetical protein